MKQKNHSQRQKKTRQRMTDETEQPTISVCMIARDEEKFLETCLESVRGLADEVIVGDTGSSDGTKAVARKAGARVLDVPWDGDFSKARNTTLGEAKGDWIFVIDCDETLTGKDRARIRDAAVNSDAAGLRMTTRNYAEAPNRVGWQACKGDYAEEKRHPGWYPTTKVRLFRNDPRIRFQGRVHELVEGSIEAIGGQIEDCSVPIHHYGAAEKERSPGMYAAAARQKAEEAPDDPQAYYELALALRDSCDFEGARTAIDRCATLLEARPGSSGPYLKGEFVYLVQGEILGKLGDRETEEAAYHRALEQNPACYEAMNNLGTLKQRSRDLEAAEGYYQRAHDLAPGEQTIRENLSRVKRLGTGAEKVRDSGGQKERLTLCMIARNEAHRLGNCLESVKGLVDEIVVVDTGSSDGTEEVARRYGAKIGHFEWCDDWSAARNVSLPLATGDWILWLDADDLLPAEAHQKIRALMKKGRDKAYYFVLDSRGYEPISCLQLRLFPNLPGVAFTMPVHEQVTPSLSRLNIKCEATDIQVVHTGYTTPEVVREKQERYLRIMENWVESHPDDYIVRSHVAMTYYIWGDFDRAIAGYERILSDGKCHEDRNLVIETTAYLFLGRCWMRKMEYGKALPHLLKAQTLDDEYATTNLTLGECHTQMGETEKALEALGRAQAFEDQVTFASKDPRAVKYSIRFFTGQNLVIKGRLHEAAEAYREASEIDTVRSGALGALSTVYRKMGLREKAIQALEEALQRDPDDPKHRFNRGTFYLEDGDETTAERWFHEALEADPDMPEPYLNLGFIAKRRRNLDAAEEFYGKADERSEASYEPQANLGHLFLDQGRYEEASEMFARVREKKRGLLDVDLGQCVADLASGRLERVQNLVSEVVGSVYGEALDVDLPSHLESGEMAQLLGEAGRMLIQKQHLMCSRLAFEAAYLLDGDSVAISLQLGEVYQSIGEAGKAVSIYENLIQRFPTDPEFFRRLGACYEKMGVPEAARLCSEQVTVLDGGLHDSKI